MSEFSHDMTGRVCLVTGATDGHGRAVAEALAASGADVVLHGRNPDKCETAQREIAEATGANIFFVKDGVLHTPTPDCFLDGITRRTAMDLARKRGVDISERAIMPEEMHDFEQCFITGTAAEVTPVSEIGPYRFEVGDLTKALMDDFTKLVQGG